MTSPLATRSGWAESYNHGDFMRDTAGTADVIDEIAAVLEAEQPVLAQVRAGHTQRTSVAADAEEGRQLAEEIRVYRTSTDRRYEGSGLNAAARAAEQDAAEAKTYGQ
jgi:hypothetical protein